MKNFDTDIFLISQQFVNCQFSKNKYVYFDGINYALYQSYTYASTLTLKFYHTHKKKSYTNTDVMKLLN